jgi:hypothetical protein
MVFPKVREDDDVEVISVKEHLDITNEHRAVSSKRVQLKRLQENKAETMDAQERLALAVRADFVVDGDFVDFVLAAMAQQIADDAVANYLRLVFVAIIDHSIATKTENLG